MKNTIHIALICDDNYVIPTIVTMNSVVANISDDYKISFHIVTAGLTDDSVEILSNIRKKDTKVLIYRRNISEYENKLQKIKEFSHVTFSALFKFELANILNNIDKVIYLDSDIIIKHDISSLYKIDVRDYYVAAVPELWKALENGNIVNNKLRYFNSGVMLINLARWREEKVSEKLWAKKMEIASDLSFRTMDQDVFNLVFYDKFLLLPIEYNFNPYFYEKKYFSLIKQYANYEYSTKEEILNAVVAVHYVGKEDKPWVYSTARLGGLWDKYYKESGFEPGKLSRKRIKKNIVYYWKLLFKMVREKGLSATCVYLIKK